MEMLLFIAENVLMVLGVASVLFSLFQYGKRSKDWKGVATVFVKRVEMTITEFKYYKFGISLLLLAVVLKVIMLTVYP